MPTCFIAQKLRRPAIDAPSATSGRTFSLTDARCRCRIAGQLLEHLGRGRSRIGGRHPRSCFPRRARHRSLPDIRSRPGAATWLTSRLLATSPLLEKAVDKSQTLAARGQGHVDTDQVPSGRCLRVCQNRGENGTRFCLVTRAKVPYDTAGGRGVISRREFRYPVPYENARLWFRSTEVHGKRNRKRCKFQRFIRPVCNPVIVRKCANIMATSMSRAAHLATEKVGLRYQLFLRAGGNLDSSDVVTIGLRRSPNCCATLSQHQTTSERFRAAARSAASERSRRRCGSS